MLKVPEFNNDVCSFKYLYTPKPNATSSIKLRKITTPTDMFYHCALANQVHGDRSDHDVSNE